MDYANAIELCRGRIEELVHSSIAATNSMFKELSSAIADLIIISSSTVKNEFGTGEESFPYKNALMFNFSQLMSSLQLLARIIDNELKMHLILKECRCSIHSRINFCLDAIGDVFTSDAEPTCQSGCFLRWMDNALEKIMEVDLDDGKETALKDFKESKSLFEDILAHAMSIVQICLVEDSKAIKGSSQSVLESLEELENELNKSEPNKAMVNLCVDSCGDKLCALERRLDLAILRFCEDNSQKKFEQQLIDNIVADFDLHVDRIMQIGLFAVFCSSNIKSGIKIRNCMASLEFLEPELIPSILMLLAEDSAVYKTSSHIYKTYWIDEAITLKKLIFEIVDPSAFCQVILDEVNTELVNILEKYKTDTEFSKTVFDSIVNLGRVLVDFILTAIRREDITDEAAVRDRIEKCCLMVREISRAIEVLEENSVQTNDRILRRCKIFKAEIKKLIIALKKPNEVDTEEVSELEKDQNSDTEENNFAENKFFNHILQRGKDILENRSILYRTPNKVLVTKPATSINEKTGKKKTVDSFLRRLSIRKPDFSFDSPGTPMSFEVNITEFLDNLSNLSTTF